MHGERLNNMGHLYTTRHTHTQKTHALERMMLIKIIDLRSEVISAPVDPFISECAYACVYLSMFTICICMYRILMHEQLCVFPFTLSVNDDRLSNIPTERNVNNALQNQIRGLIVLVLNNFRI